MGTPEFAVPGLQILVENGFDVAAVITAPDKPRGRGQKLTVTPVKDYALSQGIPVLQPTNLKAPQFIEELKSYKANLQIVVAFRMLPVAVWDMPEIGTFNLHASLLPQYRGAAPINWAIINGEKETGITTFFLKHEIDTGNIIFQEREPIAEKDTAGTLYKCLMEKGAYLVLKTVKAIEEGNYPQIPQDLSREIKPAPKIFRETCEIDWNQPPEAVCNFIRGLSPYPAARAHIAGKKFKIFSAEKTNLESAGENPGDFATDHKHYLQVQTAGAALAITELQMEGKKRMDIESFLRGTKL